MKITKINWWKHILYISAAMAMWSWTSLNYKQMSYVEDDENGVSSRCHKGEIQVLWELDGGDTWVTTRPSMQCETEGADY